MKDVICNENVGCVYCWEVSRIGRKKTVIFSITEYLAAKNIQLIVKEPYLKLLNEDGSINDAAETVLTLYAQIAESEMRNKQSRWQRTRIANSREGVWNGGANIRYGYSVDNNKRFIIDEEEATIVRLVYQLYTNESGAGQTTIKKDLERRGIFLSRDRIQKILNFEGYCGHIVNSPYYKQDHTGKLIRKIGYDLKYPAIISEEMWEAAQEKKHTANSRAYKGNNYYFAKGLLRCPACGSAYLGYKNLGLYMCLRRKHDNPDVPKCNNNKHMNINALDTLIWDAASSEYIMYRATDSDAARRAAETEIKKCRDIIAAAKCRKEKVEQKRKRTALIFADGIINESEYKSRLSNINDEISEIESDKTTAGLKIHHNWKT